MQQAYALSQEASDLQYTVHSNSSGCFGIHLSSPAGIITQAYLWALQTCTFESREPKTTLSYGGLCTTREPSGTRPPFSWDVSPSPSRLPSLRSVLVCLTESLPWMMSHLKTVRCRQQRRRVRRRHISTACTPRLVWSTSGSVTLWMIVAMVLMRRDAVSVTYSVLKEILFYLLQAAMLQCRNALTERSTNTKTTIVLTQHVFTVQRVFLLQIKVSRLIVILSYFELLRLVLPRQPLHMQLSVQLMLFSVSQLQSCSATSSMGCATGNKNRAEEMCLTGPVSKARRRPLTRAPGRTTRWAPVSVTTSI